MTAVSGTQGAGQLRHDVPGSPSQRRPGPLPSASLPPLTRAVAQQVSPRLWQDIFPIQRAPHAAQLFCVEGQQVSDANRLGQLVLTHLGRGRAAAAAGKQVR